MKKEVKEILYKKQFEIICVTKKTRDSKHAYWHCPITGAARLETSREEKFGITLYKTAVLFKEGDFFVLKAGFVA